MHIPVNGKRILMQGKKIVLGKGPWKMNKITNVAEQMRGRVRGMKPHDYSGLGRSVGGGSLQLNTGLDLAKVRVPRFLKRNNIRMNM